MGKSLCYIWLLSKSIAYTTQPAPLGTELRGFKNIVLGWQGRLSTVKVRAACRSSTRIKVEKNVRLCTRSFLASLKVPILSEHFQKKMGPVFQKG